MAYLARPKWYSHWEYHEYMRAFELVMLQQDGTNPLKLEQQKYTAAVLPSQVWHSRVRPPPAMCSQNSSTSVAMQNVTTHERHRSLWVARAAARYRYKRAFQMLQHPQEVRREYMKFMFAQLT